MILSDEEKKITAYHEAGHALVAAKLPHADPLHKVTIIPRGMALGVTMQLPIDDKHNYTRDYLEDRARHPDGRPHRGRNLPQPDDHRRRQRHRARDRNGAQDGLRVGHERSGAADLRQEGRADLPGPRNRQHRDYSEDTAIKIDAEVRKLVNQGYDTREETFWRPIAMRCRRSLWRCWSAKCSTPTKCKMLVEGKELPPMKPPSRKSDDGVQQVLKPEPGRPGIAKGGESPARA